MPPLPGDDTPPASEGDGETVEEPELDEDSSPDEEPPLDEG